MRAAFNLRQILRIIGLSMSSLLLMSMIVALSFFETWYMNMFINSYMFVSDALFSILYATLLLFFSSVILCILCLNLASVILSTRILQFIIPSVMLVSYARLPHLLTSQSLILLASGKVLSSVLLVRFWHAKFRVFRMRFGQTPEAREYLTSISQFLECRWVLIGTWLLSNLAFSLALVVQQTILQLQGWEGLLILLTFFALFWVFIRNPHSQ
jgi:hypothetical protein